MAKPNRFIAVEAMVGRMVECRTDKGIVNGYLAKTAIPEYYGVDRVIFRMVDVECAGKGIIQLRGWINPNL